MNDRISVFVRCGERFEPPSGESNWIVITLPHNLTPEDIGQAVQDVRTAIRKHDEARLLIAGPVVLGVAMGQGLAHEPTAIEYVLLNQATKRFEPWLSNRRNL